MIFITDIVANHVLMIRDLCLTFDTTIDVGQLKQIEFPVPGGLSDT